MKKLLLICATFGILFTAFSCKNDQDTTLLQLEDKALSSKSKEDTEALVRYIISSYEAATDLDKRKYYLNKGIEMAEKLSLTKEKKSFQLALVNLDPESKETAIIASDMMKSFMDNGKMELAYIMNEGIQKRFPDMNTKESQELSTLNLPPVDTLILTKASSIFNDQTGEVNKAAAYQYIDYCEAYAMSHGQSDKVLDYLFGSAEMARSLRSYPKALSLYDIIETRFPDSKKAATVLFVKGFLYEQELRDLDQAKVHYTRFIENYPQDELVPQVKLLLANLGKSDEELLQVISADTVNQ